MSLSALNVELCMPPTVITYTMWLYKVIWVRYQYTDSDIESVNLLMIIWQPLTPLQECKLGVNEGKSLHLCINLWYIGGIKDILGGIQISPPGIGISRGYPKCVSVSMIPVLIPINPCRDLYPCHCLSMRHANECHRVSCGFALAY